MTRVGQDKAKCRWQYSKNINVGGQM